MISLGFNNEFVNPVKEGVKTSTIRKHFNGKIGDKIAAYNADLFLPSFTNRSKSFGYIKITQILYIRFDEIDKEVARTEGYLHEDILKEDLYAIYDDELKDSTLLYYIQFEFIPLEQEDDTDESAE
ncbi:ASCH domain-containing protein [Methanobrevibacter sp.]|uniref:ASCH domain-containing protein n=1 Tax=Methanobrevibacter sp. TaxID=66852 RepID=UPI003866D823